MIRVMVLEDGGTLGQYMRLSLPRHYSVACYSSSDAIGSLVCEEHPDVVVLETDDLQRQLPTRLKEILGQSDPPPVIVVGADSRVHSAVRAVRAGAFDYVTQPIDLHEFEKRLRDAAVLHAPPPPDFEEPDPGGPVFVGTSAASRRVRRLLSRFAPSTQPVLLLGESGTGKEVAARVVHAASPRKSGPFIPVNCAAVPAALFESELFGSERGAFTDAVTKEGLLQLAGGGTFFLDEVGDLPLDAQAKLLRVLENGTVRRVGGRTEFRIDIRLIAATNRDLKGMVAEGGFREDLYYRIAVLVCEIPPLRARREDIPALASHYLAGDEAARLSVAAHARLMEHDWPGNVRELRNCLERARVLSDGPVIGPEAIYFP